MSNKKVLAFDFGASSGRAIIGGYDGERINMREVHRFSNDPVKVNGVLYWDFLRLFHEIKNGITNAVIAGDGDFCSLGIDTWGVDFGLLDGDGRLLENVVHYRDERTEGMTDEVFKTISSRELYSRTGIQLMRINTIFQLYSLLKNRPEFLEKADSLLMVPDLLGYFLTGEKTNEYTEASTSELLNPFTGDWDFELIEKLGLPRGIFKPVVQPGSAKGAILPQIQSETGCGAATVRAICSHDTASAVLAVPVEPGKRFAFISCGTWSLFGAELEKPCVTDASYDANYTNEGGVNRTSRFLKNIIGLWLMQECKNQWNREGKNLSFKDIDAHTVKAEPLARFINPDDELFVSPGDMPRRIANYLDLTDQPAPQDIGDYSRCITESLAMTYRRTLERLEKILGYKVDEIHIVGGGVKDKLLCQCAANAMGRPVVAGPIEATAIGNICMQLIAEGEFSSVAEARATVARSFEKITYTPQDTDKWDEAYARFLRVCNLED